MRRLLKLIKVVGAALADARRVPCCSCCGIHRASFH